MTTEKFELFRTAARTMNASDLMKEAGIKWYTHPRRMFHLAYGFLRGKPYRVMEPTARPLFDSMGHSQATFITGLIQLITFGGTAITENELMTWMSAPEPETHAAKRLARESDSKVARNARREAFKVPAVA